MSDKRFENKVAVVTGGASGIGLAIVRRLISEGARVIVADFNTEALASVVSVLGDSVAGIEVDVRIESQVQAMAELALEKFNQLDLGFNCAGLSVPGELSTLSEEDWDITIDTCLKGVFLSVKHEVNAMSDSGGSIVNIASLNCQMPMFGGVAYACAKAGVEMLSRNAALELAAKRIRVNTVSPGLTDTPLVVGLRDIPGLEAAYMGRIPMKRLGTPEDMAAAALFLASDDASYISGSNLFVDGAWGTTGYPDLQPFMTGLSPENP